MYIELLRGSKDSQAPSLRVKPAGSCPGSESLVQLHLRKGPQFSTYTIYKYLSKLLSTTAKEPSFGCCEAPTHSGLVGVGMWNPIAAWLRPTLAQLQTAACHSRLAILAWKTS